MFEFCNGLSCRIRRIWRGGLQNCSFLNGFFESSLNAPVSRVVSNSIPFYPQGRDISEFIRSLNNQPFLPLLYFRFSFNSFLSIKADRVELITQQHVINAMASHPVATLTVAQINGDPVPEISRSLPIREAMQLMEREVPIDRGFFHSTPRVC